MKILALGGCGQQGGLAVETLAAAPDVEQIIVADINITAARAFKEALGSDKIEVLQLDVTDEKQLIEAMAGVDVVANFVGPFFRLAEGVVRAAISAGVNYVDICDDAAPTVKILDEYHCAAKEAGLSMVLGLGASPGLLNVLVRNSAEQLDEVIEANVYFSVSVNDIDNDPSVIEDNAAVYEHCIELMAGTTTQYLDGEFREVQGGSGLEQLKFATLGQQNAYYVSHPEPLTLPRYIKLQTATNKGCVPGMDEVLFGIRDLGLAMHDTMRVNGADVPTARVAVSVLAHLDEISDPIPESELPACSDMFSEVKGIRDGEKITLRTDVLSHNGLPRMAEFTGWPAAVGILMMGRGQITEKGVFAPEACIEPAPFMAELENLGVRFLENRI
jgi:saccharopine dehydrogenase-like NADP-dependent oxidoreductase